MAKPPTNVCAQAKRQRAPCGCLGSVAARGAIPSVTLCFCRPADRLHAQAPGRFARFLEDGRICLTNNAAERALRGFALGRKSWLFAGSERGADRAAVMATLITTAKLNDIDPQAWLADVLARIDDHAIHRLDELLPWNWAAAMERRKVAA